MASFRLVSPDSCVLVACVCAAGERESVRVWVRVRVQAFVVFLIGVRFELSAQAGLLSASLSKNPRGSEDRRIRGGKGRR